MTINTAAINALLPDNTNREITPKDVRDCFAQVKTDTDSDFQKRTLVVDTAQELRDLTIYGGNFPETVETLGALAAGDGGGGLWQWDATSSAAEDDYGAVPGTVVLPTGHVGNGRWLRQYNRTQNSVKAAWWGLDRTGAQDVRATVQELFKNHSEVVFDENSSYLFNGPIFVSHPDYTVKVRSIIGGVSMTRPTTKFIFDLPPAASYPAIGGHASYGFCSVNLTTLAAAQAKGWDGGYVRGIDFSTTNRNENTATVVLISGAIDLRFEAFYVDARNARIGVHINSIQGGFLEHGSVFANHWSGDPANPPAGPASDPTRYNPANMPVAGTGGTFWPSYGVFVGDTNAINDPNSPARDLRVNPNSLWFADHFHMRDVIVQGFSCGITSSTRTGHCVNSISRGQSYVNYVALHALHGWTIKDYGIEASQIGIKFGSMLPVVANGICDGHLVLYKSWFSQMPTGSCAVSLGVVNNNSDLIIKDCSVRGDNTGTGPNHFFEQEVTYVGTARVRYSNLQHRDILVDTAHFPANSGWVSRIIDETSLLDKVAANETVSKDMGTTAPPHTLEWVASGLATVQSTGLGTGNRGVFISVPGTLPLETDEAWAGVMVNFKAVGRHVPEGGWLVKRAGNAVIQLIATQAGCNALTPPIADGDKIAYCIQKWLK